MRGAWLLLVMAVCGSSCGRTHTLADGVYQFSITQVLRDDCGLAARPEVAGEGRLRTTGNVVAVDYSFLNLKLVGTYLTRSEEMTLDGTAVNVSTPVRGQACLLDVVSMHLDGQTADEKTFRGALKVVFDTRTPDACVCQAWFRYEARWTAL